MTCLKPENIEPGAVGAGGLDFNPYDLMEPRAPGAVPAAFRNGRPVKDNDIAPEGRYFPNYNILTPHMRSPDYVQMSTAAAITLGIVSGQMHRCACTRCLNLLLTYPEGCRANCAYCGLARHREAERNYADRNFIRVDWPAVPMAEVVDIVARDVAGSPFHRMCISMITHPKSDEDTVAVLKTWTDRIDPDDIPISILSNPTTMTRDDVARLRGMGSDIFTVALDAATPETVRPHARQGRAVAAQLEEVLGDPDGCPRHLRPAKVRRPYHRRHGREPNTTSSASCRGSSISAAIRTCSASSPRRAP